MVEMLSVGSQLAAFLSALVAMTAFGVGVRTYRRQANAQVFLEYTGRYLWVPEILAASVEPSGERLSSSPQCRVLMDGPSNVS
jgi:hypothetical protein